MKRLLIFFIFMLLGSYLLFQVLSRFMPGLPEGLGGRNRNNILLTGVHMTHQEEGELRWELFSSRAEVDDTSEDIYMENVRLVVYPTTKTHAGTAPNTPLLVAEAGEASITGGSEVIILSNGVSLERTEGFSIKAEHLEFNQTDEILTIPGAFSIVARDATHNGTNLWYSIPEERMTLEGPVLAY